MVVVVVVVVIVVVVAAAVAVAVVSCMVAAIAVAVTLAAVKQLRVYGGSEDAWPSPVCLSACLSASPSRLVM